MDHISKALERVQADAGNVRSWVLPAASTAVDRTTAADAAVRHITLSKEHLQSQHVLCGRALGSEDPATSDQYRLLRTRVVQSMRQQGWRSVGITSSGPRVGKSLTAINLAISMARDDAYSVVLVDADLRRPSTAEILGISEGLGLIDYLASDIGLDAVLLRPDVVNLTILPGRSDQSGKAAPELLTSNKMTALFDSLLGRSRSTLVVVDLPPILLGDDVVGIAPLLDCLLVVIEEGKTEIQELRRAAELIKEFKIVGTVLNKSSERSKVNVGYYYYGTANERSPEPKGTI
jgi:protein-tyrosine kinase